MNCKECPMCAAMEAVRDEMLIIYAETGPTVSDRRKGFADACRHYAKALATALAAEPAPQERIPSKCAGCGEHVPFITDKWLCPKCVRKLEEPVVPVRVVVEEIEEAIDFAIQSAACNEDETREWIRENTAKFVGITLINFFNHYCKPCPTCGGTKEILCDDCDGRGHLGRTPGNGKPISCKTCGGDEDDPGTGKVPCPTCAGDPPPLTKERLQKEIEACYENPPGLGYDPDAPRRDFEREIYAQCDAIDAAEQRIRAHLDPPPLTTEQRARWFGSVPHGRGGILTLADTIAGVWDTQIRAWLDAQPPAPPAPQEPMAISCPKCGCTEVEDYEGMWNCGNDACGHCWPNAPYRAAPDASCPTCGGEKFISTRCPDSKPGCLVLHKVPCPTCSLLLDAQPAPTSGPNDGEEVVNHQQRHKELHNALDELVADFITHTKGMPSRRTILELIQWSAEQAAMDAQGGEASE